MKRPQLLREPRALVRVAASAGALLVLLAWLLEQGAGRQLLAAFAVNASVLMFGFAIAMALVDPLTRRHLEREETRRWKPARDRALGDVWETTQYLAVCTLNPLYTHVYYRDAAGEGAPEPTTFFYWDVQRNRQEFMAFAEDLLRRVTTALDPNLSSISPAVGQELRNGWLEQIVTAARRVRDAVEAVEVLPPQDERLTEVLMELRRTALEVEFKAQSQLAMLKIVEGSRAEAPTHALLAAFVRFHAEKCLEALRQLLEFAPERIDGRASE